MNFNIIRERTINKRNSSRIRLLNSKNDSIKNFHRDSKYILSYDSISKILTSGKTRRKNHFPPPSSYILSDSGTKKGNTIRWKRVFSYLLLNFRRTPFLRFKRQERGGKSPLNSHTGGTYVQKRPPSSVLSLSRWLRTEEEGREWLFPVGPSVIRPPRVR